jgi:hypothetical protein
MGNSRILKKCRNKRCWRVKEFECRQHLNWYCTLRDCCKLIISPHFLIVGWQQYVGSSKYRLKVWLFKLVDKGWISRKLSRRQWGPDSNVQSPFELKTDYRTLGAFSYIRWYNLVCWNKNMQRGTTPIRKRITRTFFRSNKVVMLCNT